MARIRRLLVANRSEITIRVFRAATELGIRTVAIYAEEDKLSLHRFKADEAYQIGAGKGPLEAYLSIEDVIRVAKEAKVDAIHPGYGFLSESPEFAEACAEAGIIFIGPSPQTMRDLGNKVAARNIAVASGAPVMPATAPLPDDPEGDQAPRPRDRLSRDAQGLLGRRRARHAADRERGQAPRRRASAPSARRRPPSARTRSISKSWCAARATSRCRSSAIRTAIWCISSSATVRSSAATRKSSSARPRPISTTATRLGLCEAALKIGRATKYVGAGTVEFLLDADTGKFYFIEVNPRIQVEHTVTEVVTGLDIVKAQIRIAEGRHIGQLDETGIPEQKDIRLLGHALQCRITTENPENNFIPDYGRITAYRGAMGFGIRVDGGTAYSGAIVTRFYDPLLEKVTAWAATPEEVIRRMDRALLEYRIRGVATNLAFLHNIITDPHFVANDYTTRFIDETPSLFDFKKRKDRATKLLT